MQADPVSGATTVHISQTRNSWVGKGGVLDRRQAGKRLDELTEALIQRWTAPPMSAPPPGSAVPTTP